MPPVRRAIAAVTPTVVGIEVAFRRIKTIPGIASPLVANAMGPCVVSGNVDTSRSATLHGGNHAVIRLRATGVILIQISDQGTVLWTFQTQSATLVRVGGCRTRVVRNAVERARSTGKVNRRV